jgi:hypothetical protein
MDPQTKPSQDDPITEEWLREVGFRWHQVERQPAKQWLLWLGGVIEDGLTCFEDLGVEVSPTLNDGRWHCWLRRDTAGRYSRFIHIRHIQNCGELIALIGGLTRQAWNPSNHFYGSMYTEAGAAQIRREQTRLDHAYLQKRERWAVVEEDDSRRRALPEHVEEAVKRGGAR